MSKLNRSIYKTNTYFFGSGVGVPSPKFPYFSVTKPEKRIKAEGDMDLFQLIL
jgi:hypothetical protein